MDYLNASQVASILGVSPRRVYAMAQSGRLRCKRFGHAVMFRESDLAAVVVRKSGRPAKSKPEPVHEPESVYEPFSTLPMVTSDTWVSGLPSPQPTL